MKWRPFFLLLYHCCVGVAWNTIGGIPRLFSVTEGILATLNASNSHFVASPENPCFAVRAGTCSECLQAWKDCAYCPEEVRA